MKGFLYEQATGHLGIVNGDFDCPFAAGYSGRGDHRNRAESQSVKGAGPLPRGVYRMRVVPHPRFAAPAIQLIPDGHNQMEGRSDFWIHGDNRKRDFSASEGCIILDRNIRLALAALMNLGFDDLTVIP